MQKIIGLLSVLCMCLPNLTAQIKILPLGNSITYNHYRYDLWKQLVDAELDFDLIGLRNNPPSGGGFLSEHPDYQGRTFDADHQGHPGWTTNNLLNGASYDPNAGNLAGWLAVYTPDIVLLHAGTNDVTHRSGEDTAAHITRIIEMLQADNPNVVVLLAKIIPRSGYFPQVLDINNRLDAVAENASTESSCVRIVDQYTGYSADFDNYDGIHPNRSGDVKMANKWAEAIIDVIESGNCRVAIDCSQLEVRLEADEIDCGGAQNGALRPIINGGVQPYAYEWSTGQQTYDITNLNGGNYTVTVTDGNNCAMSASFQLNEPAPLQVATNSTNITYFNTNTGNARVEVTGGIAPYEYQWSNGATTPQIENLSAGDYQVTINDQNGCAMVRSFTITQPECVEKILQINVQHLTCDGINDAFIELLNVAETDQIEWNTGQNTSAIYDLTAGNYQVTVTTNQGCISRTEITLEAPPLFTFSTSQEPTTCGKNNGKAIATAVGGTGNLHYQWSTGDTLPVLENLSGGTYQISVTDDNLCQKNATVEVASSAAIELTGWLDHPPCAGEATGQITLAINHGTPPFQYAWSNGSTDNSLFAIKAGDYRVTLTDVVGCVAIDSFQLVEETPIAVTPTLEHPTAAANGRITVNVMGGVAPYQLNWSNGQTGTIVENLAAGEYQLTVTDANDCEKVITVTLALMTATNEIEDENLEIYYDRVGQEVCLKTNLPIDSDNHLLIFTIDGKLVQRERFNSMQECIKINHRWHSGNVFVIQFFVRNERRWNKKILLL